MTRVFHAWRPVREQQIEMCKHSERLEQHSRGEENDCSHLDSLRESAKKNLKHYYVNSSLQLQGRFVRRCMHVCARLRVFLQGREVCEEPMTDGHHHCQ